MPARSVILIAALSVVACGGSSSETPKPLEPDLERAIAEHEAALAARRDPEPSAPKGSGLDRELGVQPPARATWGGAAGSSRGQGSTPGALQLRDPSVQPGTSPAPMSEPPGQPGRPPTASPADPAPLPPEPSLPLK